MSAKVDYLEGVALYDYEFEKTQEEREQIAELIITELLHDQHISMEHYMIKITETIVEDASYDSITNERYGTEKDIEYELDVEPMSYMDIVVPRILESGNQKAINYLYKALKNAGYEGNAMNLFFKV